MTVTDHASFAKRTAPAPALGSEAKLFPALYEAAHDAVAAAYPQQWCQFGHHISSHPLLTRSAIAMLAQRLPAQNVAIRGGKAGLSVVDVMSQIERGTASIELNDIDCDPRYDALMRDVLTELKPVVTAATGAMQEPAASLIIAAPGSTATAGPCVGIAGVHTVHFQLSGSRSILAFPTEDQTVIGAEQYEAALRSDGVNQGQRLIPGLVWTQALLAAAAAATRYDPAPGEALYVPAFTPHQVTVHEEMSVTLALSWQSRWSRHFGEACQLNAGLRAMGANPALPRPFPGRNWPRSYGWRAWQGWDRAKQRLRREMAAWR